MTHGTITGYATDRCRCDACRQAWRVYGRQWARDARAGRKRLRPAGGARRHLRRLINSGHTAEGIGSMVGLTGQCIRNVLSDATKSVTRPTEERILGAALGEAPRGRHLVSSADARLLLEAMRQAGIPAADIIAMLGYSSTSIIPAARNPQIAYQNYRRIRVLYELLARTGRVEAMLLDEVMP